MPAEQITILWQQRLSAPEATLAQVLTLLNSDTGFTPVEFLHLKACQMVCLVGLYQLAEVPALVEEVRSLREELELDSPELEAELNRCSATILFYASEDIEALQLTVRSLELARKVNNRELIALAHGNIAAIFGRAEEYKSALRHLQSSLQLTPESETNPYGSLLNNLGNIYLHLERIDEALACFQRARGVFVKCRNPMMAALALTNVGRAYRGLLLFEKALAAFEQALQEFADGSFSNNIPVVLYKLGSVHAATGDIAEAERHYLAALEYYQPDHEVAYEAETRRAYAEFLLSQERVAEAITHLETVRILQQDQAGLDGRANVLQLLATAYENSGETTQALAAMKEFIRLKDEHSSDLARAAIAADAASVEPAAGSQHELMELTTGALLAANRQLASDSKQLEQLAMTDSLTGLRNRHYLAETLGHAFTGHRAGDGAFSLLMLDIDQFKRVNDSFGHNTGDDVLRQLALIFVNSVRSSDVVARWGGEEFIIFLSQASLQVAAKVAEKLRKAVESHDWDQIASGLKVTVSLGVVFAGDHPELDIDGLVAHVDRLLYEAKGQGRNRVLMINGSGPIAEASLP